MSARVEADQARLQAATEAQSTAVALGAALPLAPIFDADADLGSALPPDHPAWIRDAVSISQRARVLLANLRPVAIRVMTMWDHAVRSLVIGGRRLDVDASGSYRMR